MFYMKKRVLILSNHFITIYRFRKELINRLIENKYDVYLSLPASAENKYFNDLGCNIVETEVNRRGMNPLQDIKLIIKYVKIIREINPDIIFSYTIKPNIYGSLAANMLKKRQIANITGTGGTFLKSSIVSQFVKLLYKCSIKKTYKVMFQNTGDMNFFVRNKLVKNNYELLPGSGVNLEEFRVVEYPKGEIIKFIFIGRVMRIKGIDEFIKMSKSIKGRYPNTEFYIAGFIEENNYKKLILECAEEGIINFLGYQNNIKSRIEEAHCIILPSHGGEGVPNVILEAAAIGRPAIVSSICGSTDVVVNGENGYLFEAENSQELIDRVIQFLELSYEEKKQMGIKGRIIVEEKFDRNIIIDKYLYETSLV